MPCSKRSLAARLALTLMAATCALAATASYAVNQDLPNKGAHNGPRTGDFSILSQGTRFILANCKEGGNVAVSLNDPKTNQPMTGEARQDAVRRACKDVDYQ